MLTPTRCIGFALGLLMAIWGPAPALGLPLAIAMGLCLARQPTVALVMVVAAGFGVGELVWQNHPLQPPPADLEVTVARDTVHRHQSVLLDSPWGRLRWARPDARYCAGTVLSMTAGFASAVPAPIDGKPSPFRRALARGELARLRAVRGLKVLKLPGPIRRVACHLRQGAADALRHPLEPRLQPLALAIFMGERGFGDRSDADNLRSLGLAHLLAVSGLHVGLALGLLLGALRLAPVLSPRLRAVGWHRRLLAVVTCAAVCWWCAWPVGGQRLLAWACLNLIAPHRPLRITGWASMALLLVADPASAADLGFLLSHGISMALVELLRFWRGPLSVPTIASVATALPLALCGLPSPLLSIAANTVFVPLFLPCFAAAGLLLATGHGALANALLCAFLDLCGTVADQVRVGALTLELSITAACAIAIAFAAILQGRARAACGVLCMALMAAPVDPGTQVWMLPIGHGDAAWIRRADASVVVDTGPSPQRLRSTLLPLLPDHPDLLIISHADHDHVGGVDALCDERPPKATWSHTPLPPNCPPPSPPKPVRLGGLSITPLPLADDWVQGRNDRSLIVRIEAEGQRILMLGDIGLDREDDLAHRFGSADVVKVPHHGSRTSSGTATVREMAAKVALIGAGPWDRFGHPHREVVARWRASGSVVDIADWRPICWSLTPNTPPRPCIQLQFLRRGPTPNLHPTQAGRRLAP